MQSHVIAVLRWLYWHRYEIALTAALAITTAFLVLVGPVLLALAAVEWKQARRRQRLLSLVLVLLLARTARWLWRELRGSPQGGSHPCGQCGVPIAAPSRAEYCSPACRRYAHLTRAETARRATALAQYGEVPF